MSADLENRVDELFAWAEELQKQAAEERKETKSAWAARMKEFEAAANEMLDAMAAERKAAFRDGLIYACSAGVFAGAVAVLLGRFL